MNKLTFALLIMVMSIPAMAYIPDMVPSRSIQMVKVMSSGGIEFDTTRKSVTYRSAVSGCSIEEISSLTSPVAITGASRTIRQGHEITFTGSNGKTVTCEIKDISLK